MRYRSILAVLLLTLCAAPAPANGQDAYVPARVVYDFSSADPANFKHLLERISMLQNLYASDPLAASIVVVIHEGAVPLFTSHGHHSLPDLLERAHGLALSEIIRFRLCKTSARMQGYSAKNFKDFVELVPMADAEIVRLVHNGYAYLRP